VIVEKLFSLAASYGSLLLVKAIRTVRHAAWPPAERWNQSRPALNISAILRAFILGQPPLATGTAGLTDRAKSLALKATCERSDSSLKKCIREAMKVRRVRHELIVEFGLNREVAAIIFQ